MNHALKIESISNTPITQLDAIADQLSSIATDLGLDERKEEIECRRRDGYIPHAWNMGGYRSYGYSYIDSVMGSGYSAGSDITNNLIEGYYNETIAECYREYLKSIELSIDTEFDTLTDDQKNDYYNMESDYFCNDYDSICFEYQGRYLGYENGIHTISLNGFWNVSDAPYFRGSDDDIEIIITFRDINSKNCQNKIDKAVSKLHDFIGSIELY